MIDDDMRLIIIPQREIKIALWDTIYVDVITLRAPESEVFGFNLLTECIQVYVC